MEIYRERNKLEGELSLELSGVANYIAKIIDLHSAASISHTKWLTKREREFFVALIIVHNSGISDHKSDEAGEIYNEIFGSHRKKDRGDYITRLEGKKWVRVVGGDVEVMPLFDEIDLSNDSATFNINLKFEDGNRQHLGTNGVGESN